MGHPATARQGDPASTLLGIKAMRAYLATIQPANFGHAPRARRFSA
jgi:hypothetical protein